MMVGASDPPREPRVSHASARHISGPFDTLHIRKSVFTYQSISEYDLYFLLLIIMFEVIANCVSTFAVVCRDRFCNSSQQL